MKYRVIARIGNGDRSPVADLLLKNRDHAAGRAENIAETSDDETRGRGVAQSEHIFLGQVLGRAHHACRIDGFVGRNLDEAADIKLVGQVGDAFRAVNVVFDGLARIGLHQRHMLMRGGVEDDIGSVVDKNLPHPVFIGHIADARAQRPGRGRGLQFPFNRKNPVLAAADHDQGPRLETEHLPADFRSDATPGAGDQDRAAINQGTDGTGVELHGIAAQKIVDVDVADRNLRAAVEELFRRGNDLERESRQVAGADQGPHAHGPAGSPRSLRRR